MLEIFKGKIDKLVNQFDKLTIKRQRIEDRKNLLNSKLGNRIKALEALAWRNQVIADTQISDIDRKTNKITKDIENEKEYVNGITTTQNHFKPVTPPDPDFTDAREYALKMIKNHPIITTQKKSKRKEN